MKAGVWTFKRLEEYAILIDACEYQGKKYLLFLDYNDCLILVNITDGWYIYIYKYMIRHNYYDINDNSYYKLGDD